MVRDETSAVRWSNVQWSMVLEPAGATVLSARGLPVLEYDHEQAWLKQKLQFVLHDEVRYAIKEVL